MEDTPKKFDDDFLVEGRALLRKMGVPDDLASVYLRFVPLCLMGLDENTASTLACQMEAAAQEGEAETRPKG